ncbi:hypothetical protein [Spartinivicinus poritis]|uniref:Uncharacterized protein n=1 Tax=Spartinivicinus poritis TaxID=2994640 RepID=A0ABT5UHL3_9GAMM|nr:hypothetical protein [Spartinivicinus sp. A2-2]MDE1465812.1 hypothetical protein [Spartinivicinus sp. A2-2]
MRVLKKPWQGYVKEGEWIKASIELDISDLAIEFIEQIGFIRRNHC